MEKYVLIYRLSKIDYKYLKDTHDKNRIREEFLSLGLRHQIDSTRRVVGDGKIVAEFKEITSGQSKKLVDTVYKALELCKRERAHLVLSTVDRLSRVAFHIHNVINEMEQAGLKVIFSDAPDAGKMYVSVLAAQAEKEWELASKRQKDAFNMAKKYGTSTGNWYGNPILKKDPSLYDDYRRMGAAKRRQVAQENPNRQRALAFVYGLYYAARDKRVRNVARLKDLLNANGYVNIAGEKFDYHSAYYIYKIVANGSYRPNLQA